MGIVVEVVGRNGAIIRSQKFNSSKVSIGRAYDCDVILPDAHVDSEHLMVHLDATTQGLRCEDINSLNGSWLIEPSKFQGLHKHKRQVLHTSPIFSGQALVLGRTYLRIYSSEHWVAPTQALSIWEDFGHFLGSYWLVSFMGLALVALEMWNAYLDTPHTKKIFEYALSGVYPLLAVVAYAFIWAMVGKSAKHDSKLFTHISVGLFTVFILGLVTMFLPPLVYAFGLGSVQTLIFKLIMIIICYCSLSATLIFATNLKRLSRNIFASFIPIALLMPYVLNLMTKSDFQSRPEYDLSLARPAWSLRKPVEPAEFLEFAQGIYPEEVSK